MIQTVSWVPHPDGIGQETRQGGKENYVSRFSLGVAELGIRPTFNKTSEHRSGRHMSTCAPANGRCGKVVPEVGFIETALSSAVIPEKAGIQTFCCFLLDSRLRGNDNALRHCDTNKRSQSYIAASKHLSGTESISNPVNALSA